MALTTLTSKGQVTIPKVVRNALKLRAGDKIEIVIKNDQEAIIRPITRSVDDVFCKLQKAARKTISIEEMDAAIKKKVRESV